MATGESKAGALWVVFTPIGDPRDMAPRALDTLAEADARLAEEPEALRRLCAELGRPLGAVRRYRDDDLQAVAYGRAALAAGARVALASRAGGPGVSDPGWRLVDEATRMGARVRVAPGPSALTAALAACGFRPTHSVFHGFVPVRPSARARWLEAVALSDAAHIAFLPARDAAAFLQACAEALGEAREAALAREMTKTHEEHRRAPLGVLARAYASGAARALGEMTLVIAADPQGARKRRLARALRPALAALGFDAACALVAAQTAEPVRRVRAEARALAP